MTSRRRIEVSQAYVLGRHRVCVAGFDRDRSRLGWHHSSRERYANSRAGILPFTLPVIQPFARAPVARAPIRSRFHVQLFLGTKYFSLTTAVGSEKSCVFSLAKAARRAISLPRRAKGAATADAATGQVQLLILDLSGSSVLCRFSVCPLHFCLGTRFRLKTPV